MVDIEDIDSMLIRSKSDFQKRIVIVRLKRILTKKSIPELISLRKTFDNEEIVKYVEFEIWRRALDHKPENLLKIIRESDNNEMVCEAIKELGKQKKVEMVDLFIEFLENRSQSIRRAAALALLENPNQKAFQPLIDTIKKHKDSCAELVDALAVLDCHNEIEFLVDLFISKSTAPMVRICIIECFEGNSIKSISSETGKKIKKRIFDAIHKSKDEIDQYELQRFYEEAVEPKIKILR